MSSGIEVSSDDEVTSPAQPIRCLVLDGVINERQMEIFGSLLHNRGMITFANNESFSLSSDTKIFWEVRIFMFIKTALTVPLRNTLTRLNLSRSCLSNKSNKQFFTK